MKSEETNLDTLLQELRRAHEPALREKGLDVVHRIAAGSPPLFTAKAACSARVRSQLLECDQIYRRRGGDPRRRMCMKQVAACCISRCRTAHRHGLGITWSGCLSLCSKPMAAPPTSRHRHGSGAVQTAVWDAMKARIWAESKPGQGSTFHVEVPVEAFRHPKEHPLVDLALVWTDDLGRLACWPRELDEKAGAVVESVSSRRAQSSREVSEAAFLVIDAHEVQGGRAGDSWHGLQARVISSFTVRRTL